MVLVLISSGGVYIRHYGNQFLGGLVTPRYHGSAKTYLELGAYWGMDNDCYKGLNRIAVINVLKRNQQYSDTCLWVAAPDVVGDAAATLERFEEWKGIIKSYGYPVALVAQDGIGELNKLGKVPWYDFDAIFVGGSTEFKLSHESYKFIQEAKRRGKWVHMGRVSTPDRMELAGAWGCHSVDSTSFSRAGWLYLWWAIEIAAIFDTVPDIDSEFYQNKLKEFNKKYRIEQPLQISPT